MDIGIMPLTDTPWANGKCGYKLLQYMACGLPVIASPVGVNEKIVEHGVNGFLAQTDEDWKFYIKKLLSDSDLRCRMGAAGRKKVEKEFSLQVWGPHVAKTMQELLSGVSKT
jgi:glycosyltransferase involved in cell wall biosynthesis